MGTDSHWALKKAMTLLACRHYGRPARAARLWRGATCFKLQLASQTRLHSLHRAGCVPNLCDDTPSDPRRARTHCHPEVHGYSGKPHELRRKMVRTCPAASKTKCSNALGLAGSTANPSASQRVQEPQAALVRETAKSAIYLVCWLTRRCAILRCMLVRWWERKIWE